MFHPVEKLIREFLLQFAVLTFISFALLRAKVQGI